MFVVRQGAQCLTPARRNLGLMSKVNGSYAGIICDLYGSWVSSRSMETRG